MKVKRTREQLHKTYNTVMEILKRHDIKVIIYFGTLLGYVRENNFIEGDDDIDVLVTKEQLQTIYNIIRSEKISINIHTSHFMQLKTPHGLFDFYVYEIRDDNTIYLKWERYTLDYDEVFPNKEKKFFEYKVMVPKNSVKFLEHRYGKEKWKTPI